MTVRTSDASLVGTFDWRQEDGDGGGGGGGGGDGEEAATAAKVTVKVAGFQDATAVLRAACKALIPGQMVHAHGFSMMDSMGAIQIMDRRMDSGMASAPEDTPVDDRLTDADVEMGMAGAGGPSAFNVDADLSVEETCWVMDRLLACETCWQSGSALKQTIQTCLYMHHVDYLYCGHGDPNACDDLPETLASTVLRAYLVALLKCCAITWDELSKGHVLDGEDWTGDKSGCSLLDDLDCADVLALLGDTIQMILKREGCCSALSSSAIEALATRLQFRKHLLMSLMILADPYLSALDDLEMHAHFLKTSICALTAAHTTSAEDPSSSSHSSARPKTSPEPTFLRTGRIHAPSRRIKAAFDPTLSRKLTSVVPLRPISLPSGSEVGSFWTGWARELGMLLHFGKGPVVGLGWTQWQNYVRLRASRYQAQHPAPYLRSVTQSIICNQNHLVAGKFAPIWHTHAFLREVAAVDAQEIANAVATRGYSQSSRQGGSAGHTTSGSGVSWRVTAIRRMPLSQALDSFYGRLGGNLSGYLSSLCQNRPRQTRSLAKACKQWADLAEEAQELERRLADEVKLDIPSDVHYAAIQHLTLDIMLDIFFSGFELELYRPDEWAPTYWIAGQVAAEQAQLCAEFADVLEDGQDVGVDAEALGKGGSSSAARSVSASASATLLRHRGKFADLLTRLCEAQLAFYTLVTSQPLSKPSSSESEDGPNDRAIGKTTSNDAAHLAIFRRRLKWIESAPRLADRAGRFWERFCVERDALEGMSDDDLVERITGLYAQAETLCGELDGAACKEARTELCDQLYRETLAQLKAVAVRNAAWSRSRGRRRTTRLDDGQRERQADMGTATASLSTTEDEDTESRRPTARRTAGARWSFEVHPWFGCVREEGATSAGPVV